MPGKGAKCISALPCSAQVKENITSVSRGPQTVPERTLTTLSISISMSTAVSASVFLVLVLVLVAVVAVVVLDHNLLTHYTCYHYLIIRLVSSMIDHLKKLSRRTNFFEIF